MPLGEDGEQRRFKNKKASFECFGSTLSDHGFTTQLGRSDFFANMQATHWSEASEIVVPSR